VTVKIQEKHQIRKDETLAISTFLRRIFGWDRAQVHPTIMKRVCRSHALLSLLYIHSAEYEIQLKDSKKRIWINLDAVGRLCSAPHVHVLIPSHRSLSHHNQGRMSWARQNSQALKNTPHIPEQAPESLKSASDAAAQKLREFKTVLDRLGRAKYSVETMLKLGRAVSEVRLGFL
jgi:hypothetical protein